MNVHHGTPLCCASTNIMYAWRKKNQLPSFTSFPVELVWCKEAKRSPFLILLCTLNKMNLITCTLAAYASAVITYASKGNDKRVPKKIMNLERTEQNLLMGQKWYCVKRKERNSKQIMVH